MQAVEIYQGAQGCATTNQAQGFYNQQMQNCTIGVGGYGGTYQGYGQACNQYHYYSYPQLTYTYATYAVPEIEIRTVANGFVVKHACKEYVFKTAHEMSVWIEKHYKEQNKVTR